MGCRSAGRNRKRAEALANVPRIHWLRHAESASNAGLKCSDQHSIPLTDHGRTEAARHAAALEWEPEVIVISRYLRAQETAEPFIARFPAARRLELEVHEFTFLDPVRCRDTTHEERKGWVAEFYARNDPDWVDGPGTESFHQFRGRVQRALKEILALPCERVLVVSHGQVMHLLRLARRAGSFEAVTMAQFRADIVGDPIPNLALHCLGDDCTRIVELQAREARNPIASAR